MARKPAAPSYAELTIEPAAAVTEARKVEEYAALPASRLPRTLKRASIQHILYLHPAAAKALKRYAVEENTKVHDILIDALEAWFRAHGLREPVRAETKKTREAADKLS
jgi:hypothetical protein